MSQCDRQRHELRGLVGGITKHHALVTGTGCLLHGHLTLAGLQGRVHTLSNIRGLLIQRNQDAAGCIIKTVLGTGVADILHGIADNLGNIHITAGGNLAHHVHLTRGHQCLTGYAALRVLSNDGIKDGIGNLVSHFVGMSFGNGLGSEQHAFLAHNFASFANEH